MAIDFKSNIKAKIKKYINYLLILFVFLTLLGLARSINKARQVREMIKEKQEKVDKLNKENEEFKKRLKEVTSDEYIEKQLRDSLGLAKEGEIVVVLPDKETLKALAPHIEEEEDSLPDPNWKRWVHLFGL
jgi:cell division protein FtsB